jgi:formiminoglutamase
MIAAEKIIDYLEPINLFALSNDEGYNPQQLGSQIRSYQRYLPELMDVDVILLGVNDLRGSNEGTHTAPANEIRHALYELFFWHNDIKIADIGNIKNGNTLNDTYFALSTTLQELLPLQKKVIIMGGSNDFFAAQYKAYAGKGLLLEATGIDALLDLDETKIQPAQHYLYNILTTQPNYVKRYNHLGFQSYYVNPKLLEAIDKLQFECHRVGWLKEYMNEAEPYLRTSQLIYFDINAIANTYAPAHNLSPNGLLGDEACMLMQYAGMATQAHALGLYGYNPTNDTQNLTAKQLAQMIWYYFDGVHKQLAEYDISQSEYYESYHIVSGAMDTKFLISKNTGRYWMQMPNGNYIACTANDYQKASRNIIPERWYKNQ